MKRFVLPCFLTGLFILTRLYIWFNRPFEFTEIIYSYMPYAHLWASGVKPYLEQWYEYPPATIPLFYLPHLIDRTTQFWSLHINYLQAYRGLLLLIDTAVFTLIWLTLRKLKTPVTLLVGSLVYYSLITAKANHFLYDSMDLTFAAAMTLAVVSPILWKGNRGTFGEWIGYWLAAAFKYINLPLGLFYILWNRSQWKKTLLIGLLALVVIWGLPLALYRSSLSVSLVYHQIRGIQVDSTPAIVIRTIDAFTDSESVIEVYKNYETQGPITEVAKKVMSIVFPVALVTYLAWGAWVIFHTPTKSTNTMKILLTFGYVLVFLLSGKVLSRPFLIWLMPLLPLIPFKNFKQQLMFMLPSIVIVVTTLSLTPNWEIGPFSLPLIVGWVRVVCLGFLTYLTLRYTFELTQPRKTK